MNKIIDKEDIDRLLKRLKELNTLPKEADKSLVPVDIVKILLMQRENLRNLPNVKIADAAPIRGYYKKPFIVINSSSSSSVLGWYLSNEKPQKWTPIQDSETLKHDYDRTTAFVRLDSNAGRGQTKSNGNGHSYLRYTVSGGIIAGACEIWEINAPSEPSVYYADDTTPVPKIPSTFVADKKMSLVIFSIAPSLARYFFVPLEEI